jgi:hypothetical protein
MNIFSQSAVEEKGENNFVLSHQEALAASPDDMAVCGEEDPGEGLEFLVADEN